MDHGNEPVVNLTPSCGLRGKLISVSDAADGQARAVYGFFGIPYAEPPTGVHRFRDPRPVTLWDGTRDATQYGSVCPQNFAVLDALPFPVTKPASVSEDCLFLNIYTPSLDKASRLPVMFWIHGGGFTTGFSNQYDGKGLAAKKNVVVVIINYRLGPFGFLCTNDSASMGNYGILDQIEALKWVQKQIVHFGGNPDNVTIFGQSAGGMSVSLLVVSPLAKGLFHRAIAESGAVFGGDLVAGPPEKAAEKLRSILIKKYPDQVSATSTGTEIVEFLRQLPADDLVTLDDNVNVVIDGRVLPKSPADMYKSATDSFVDLLLGVNNDEGTMIFKLIAAKFGVKPEQLNLTTATIIITSFVSIFFTLANNQSILDAVSKEYLGGLEANAPPVEFEKAVVEFMGDIMFVIPAIKTADHHSRTSKTYLYHFRYRPSFAWYPEWALADHGSEVILILDRPDHDEKLSSIKLSDEDKQISEQLRSYWVNFAKTGNPNGENLTVWPECNTTTKEHLIIQLPMAVGSRLKENRAKFWLEKLPKIIEEVTTAAK